MIYKRKEQSYRIKKGEKQKVVKNMLPKTRGLKCHKNMTDDKRKTWFSKKTADANNFTKLTEKHFWWSSFVVKL